MNTHLRMETDPKALIALSVSPNEEDHLALQKSLLPAASAVYEADGPSAALATLRRYPVGVVLCERDLGPGTWIDVLELLHGLPDEPPLIVTSRLADETLWADALNRGAYDVLAKPFDQQELNRTVNLAWLRWYHRRDLPMRTPKVMTIAG
jgi:DNA-binding NtrC family response regulator